MESTDTNTVVVRASEVFGFDWAVEKAIVRNQNEERGMSPAEYTRWLGATEIMVWGDPDDENEICTSYRDEGEMNFQEEGSALWQELGGLIDADIFMTSLAEKLL
jgi:hypothetical protein